MALTIKDISQIGFLEELNLEPKIYSNVEKIVQNDHFWELQPNDFMRFF